MKRTFLSAVLAVFFFVSPVFPASWSSVAEKALKSTVSLQIIGHDNDNFCSGIVIDDQRDYVLTAEHCVIYALRVGKRFTVNGKEGTVVMRDTPEDLAVVRVEDLNLPAIKPSKKDLRQGDFVMTLGYAYGATDPQVRISNLVYKGSGVQVGDGWCDSSCYGVAIDHIGGMSGGPVVDSDGKLVGIVQFGDGKTGFGRTIKVILERVGKYFQSRG